MNIPIVLIVLNLVLVILAGAFSIKNVLMNFKQSKSTAKNTALILCLIAALSFAFLGGTNALAANESIHQLKYDLSKVDDSVVIDEHGNTINTKTTGRWKLD